MSYTKITRAAFALLFALAGLLPANAQTYTVLYSFTGGTDGGYPYGGLIRDSAGNLYGTTGGFVAGGTGTVFRLTPKGRLKTLHSFTGPDGSEPSASLIRDTAGNFYGTTSRGGASDWGTVFRVKKNGNFKVLYTFTGGADGGYPSGPLVLDTAGNLYGVTSYGGDPNCLCGVVFKLDKKGHETVLHTFSSDDGGLWPGGGLNFDSAGALYGTTASGGDMGCGDPRNIGCGIVFKLDGNGNETVLHRFRFPLGDSPEATLLRDGAGNLYGTTSYGGHSQACLDLGCGIVFKLNSQGGLGVLHDFTGGADGAIPSFASLIMDAEGNLYGTTISGGSLGSCDYSVCGVVFKLDPSHNETVLHTFGPDNPELGLGPEGGVIMDSAGNLYGTTADGGAFGRGVIFKITP